MKRLFINLRGQINVDDVNGTPFQTDLQAFQAGAKLAAELSEIRPELCGNTCVTINSTGQEGGYFVSISHR